MSNAQDQSSRGVPYRLLEPAEHVDVEAEADEGVLVVTDRRLAISLNPGRFDLDIPFEALRRIQFDIERERPATLVVVPEHPSDPPIVLAIPPEQYDAVSEALVVTGRRLHEISTESRRKVKADTVSS